MYKYTIQNNSILLRINLYFYTIVIYLLLSNLKIYPYAHIVTQELKNSEIFHSFPNLFRNGTPSKVFN